MSQAQESILVLDDEQGIREACRRALEGEGYAVETASTARAGLRKIREQRFDLILLDVVMPDMRGIDLLAPIHEQDPNIVCIIITGFATAELAVQAIKAGAYDFLSKPFTLDLLLMTVHQGLERRRLSLEAERLAALEQEAARLTYAKEELERLDRYKTTFMLTVAHELRAPLTALQSFLLALLKGYIPAEQQQKTLQRAIERSQELLDLVDDLLKLAAVKGEAEIEKREVLSLAESLEKVFELLEARADEKGLDYNLEVHQRPQVKADPGQMTQLWTNLISNAIKYTPSGGQVQVALEEDGGWAVGAVEDTGIGIGPEDQERIFEEFYRTPQAKQMESRGTGLGLTLVKRIVEGHGGIVSVRSAPEEGSRFTFRLPTVTT
jgi:signal transduction histidine kinase